MTRKKVIVKPLHQFREPIKLLEKDDKIAALMEQTFDVADQIKVLEVAFDDDIESIITNERYVYIGSVIRDCCTKKSGEKLTTSDKIDRIVTNRWAALPVFCTSDGVGILYFRNYSGRFRH